MYLPYVYKLTDKHTGKWYIGSRTAKKCVPEELGVGYFTSSQIVAPLFRAEPFRFDIEILVASEDFEYIIKVEADMLMFRDAKNDPLSYNMHNGDGKMNTKKAGAISGRTVGKRMFEEKTGLFAPELRGKGGRVAGKFVFEKKLGLFGRSKEKHSSDSSKAGNKTVEAKLGFHSWTFEQFSEHNKRNGKTLNSQKWKCDACGKETTPGPLTRHQKFSGHSGKTRII